MRCGRSSSELHLAAGILNLKKENGILLIGRDVHGDEEAETLALLADPTHMQMSELELVRALQSDRDGGQEERY